MLLRARFDLTLGDRPSPSLVVQTWCEPPGIGNLLTPSLVGISTRFVVSDPTSLVGGMCYVRGGRLRPPCRSRGAPAPTRPGTELCPLFALQPPGQVLDVIGALAVIPESSAADRESDGDTRTRELRNEPEVCPRRNWDPPLG